MLPWFWGTNKETAAVILRPKSPNHSYRFRDPNRETLHHLGFEAQPRNRHHQFWGQIRESVTTGFEAKLEKTISLVLRSNPWQTVNLGLRLNQDGANHTWCHPTSRSFDHQVPDLCDHSRSSASDLLLLPRSSLLHAISHLPPAHHKTSKHNSPNETKIKVKQLNRLGFEFKSRQVNDSSQLN
jgi:hypothetical protein